MELFLLAAYCAGVIWYCIRTDGKATRLSGLAMNGEVQAGWEVMHARGFGNRRVGLLNHATLPPKSALLLHKSNSVHTRGMLFAIDLVFLNKQGKILATKEVVAPGVARLKGPSGTAMVLELPAGTVGSLLDTTKVTTLSFSHRGPAAAAETQAESAAAPPASMPATTATADS